MIAGALDYAHRHDVVHRDVKPENVLLHEGEAIVADFGIARAFGGAREDSANLTAAGVAIGTPAYMSPEQASGEGVVDGRTDQYSLASVVFEMLTGQPPFVGHTVQATLAQRLSKDAPSVHAFRPQVPDYVEQAIGKGLARNPDERFETTAEFASTLRGELVVYQPTLTVDTPVAAQSIAVLPFANIGADPETEYFSDGITEDLIIALAKVEGRDNLALLHLLNCPLKESKGIVE